ncbi:MAG: hypothetical protein MMC33_009755 [Icmadophila ericetorum]|nr:hypothetical protein [Icmadophila ericetorum]
MKWASPISTQTCPNRRQFFTKLSALFDSTRKADHGSIFLTQKRLTHGSDLPSPTSSEADPLLADLHPTPLPILMRATDGNSQKSTAASKTKPKVGKASQVPQAPKVKLSTVVRPEDLEEFYVRYAEICKVGMLGLRKRDRSGRKKAKGAKAKKRKGPAVGEGEKKV